MGLLDKISVAGLELNNRVAMAPLTRGRATERGVPTKIMATYYEQRAGAGLIISEGTTISQQASGWYCAPGIYTDEQREAWKPVTQAVHAKGGKIAMQLWHLGRQCSSQVTGLPIVSSSSEPLTQKVTAKQGAKVDPEVPHSLTVEEIGQVVKDYANATKNAMEAGFDMVEIHGANGYLIDQFTQTKSNKRTDDYGGSIENRLRFMNEVMDAVIDAAGSASKVGIRLSPNGVFGEMGSEDNVETFSQALRNIADRKLGYVHIMDGLGFGFHNLTKPFTLAMAREIVGKDMVIMGNVGYTLEEADKCIASGDADMIAIGRPFIGTPDLVERFREGIAPNPDAPQNTWWDSSLGAKGYIDFPSRHEVQANAEKPASEHESTQPAEVSN